MNSVVGSVNSVFYPCIVKSCDFTVNAQGKKKKKKLENATPLSVTFSPIQTGTISLSLSYFISFLNFLEKKKRLFFYNLKKKAFFFNYLEKGKFLKKSLGPV